MNHAVYFTCDPANYVSLYVSNIFYIDYLPQRGLVYVCFQTKVMFPICRIFFQSNWYVSFFQYPMYDSNIHRAVYLRFLSVICLYKSLFIKVRVELVIYQLVTISVSFLPVSDIPLSYKPLSHEPVSIDVS